MNKNNKGFASIMILVDIIAIISAILFISVPNQKAELRAFDAQIRAELSQVRSNAELWYYDYNGGNGSYKNFHKSSGWEVVSTRIPNCSKALLDDQNDPMGSESYQLIIQDNNNAPFPYQRYIAWAPLCSPPLPGITTRAYCVDSLGNVTEVELAAVRRVNENTDNDYFNCFNLPLVPGQ